MKKSNERADKTMSTIYPIQIDQHTREQLKQLAQKDFSSGLNCAESIFRAFVQAELIDAPLSFNRFVCGFGGGGGSAGYSCGALCGGIALLGGAFGKERENPYQIDGVDERRAHMRDFTQRIVNNFANEFARLNGSALCREICDIHHGYNSPERKDFCQSILLPNTTELLCNYLEMSQEALRAMPYGQNVAGYR